MTATVLVLVIDGARTLANCAGYCSGPTITAEDIQCAAETAAQAATQEAMRKLRKPEQVTH